MKQIEDTKTRDLLADVPRPRGRPATGQALSAAERKRRSRALKQQEQGVVPYTVDLPADLVAQLNEFLKFKDKTRSQLFEHLVRTQVLRKR